MDEQLRPPAAYDVAVLWSEFDAPVHAPRPLLGYQGRAASAERVEDDAAVLYGVWTDIPEGQSEGRLMAEGMVFEGSRVATIWSDQMMLIV